MRYRASKVVLLAAVLAGGAQAAEVEAYGTTLARFWNQSYQEFSKNRYAPLTQFVGVDASQLANSNWSVHLFGWGNADLGDQSGPRGKNGGDLTYGYVQYRGASANQDYKIGRITINDGIGIEQVDGASARADLRGGFTYSVFAGKPVTYPQAEGAPALATRDFIAGARLGWRLSKIGEIGLSYLQDGTTSTDPKATTLDLSRKLLGGDFRIAPHTSVDLSGRVVFDQKKAEGGDESSSRLAEQDYNLVLRLTGGFEFAGNYVERNFKDYFAGTNMPALFRQMETEKYKAQSASLTYGVGGAFQIVADYKSAKRESNGTTNRLGADFRMANDDLKLKYGLGYHRVMAADVPFAGGTVAFYSLSHSEARAWLIHDGGSYYASLDAIHYRFDDQKAPMLEGEPTFNLAVASVGYRPAKDITISGDVSYGMNMLYKKEVQGLVRIEFRFGTGSKKGDGK
jgi:hypothetical protein